MLSGPAYWVGGMLSDDVQERPTSTKDGGGVDAADDSDSGEE